MRSPTKIKAVIGANLKSLYEQSGLTQQQLAKKAGISQANVSRIMSGATHANVVTLIRLRDALRPGCPLDYLLTNLGKEKP